MDNIKELVKDTNLKHIAIIMDGNRRWAKNKNLPTAVGHKKGAEALKKTLKACHEFGIKYLTVYAFSTENWNRKPEEVSFLMDLLVQTLKTELDEMNENDVVVRFIGDKDSLNDKLREIMINAEEKTANNTGVNLQIAFNYGARAEIIRAVQAIVKNGEENITEETVQKYLYTSDIPDPDLLIRTGGEMRVSNYLLWQIAYSEIIVLQKFWPEFGKDELADCVKEFAKRNRRYGS